MLRCYTMNGLPSSQRFWQALIYYAPGYRTVEMTHEDSPLCQQPVSRNLWEDDAILCLQERFQAGKRRDFLVSPLLRVALGRIALKMSSEEC
jgi:hypothetical protein